MNESEGEREREKQRTYQRDGRRRRWNTALNRQSRVRRKKAAGNGSSRRNESVVVFVSGKDLLNRLFKITDLKCLF